MARGPRPVAEGPFPLQCMVIERVGRRVLLIGGYCLMTCWGSIFTVALCLQVAGGDEGGGGVPADPHLTPSPLLQSSFPWMPYLAMSCIFAFILSFGIGPGEWAQGALGFGTCRRNMGTWMRDGWT